MEISLKEVIFLAIFVIVGVALFQPIISVVHNITTATITSGNTTVSNPEYVGSSNVPLVNLVPIFYLVVLIVVPAVIAYKVFRE